MCKKDNIFWPSGVYSRNARNLNLAFKNQCISPYKEIKKKNHMIIWANTEKGLWQKSNIHTDLNSQWTRNENELFALIIDIFKKLAANIIFNDEKLNYFLQRWETIEEYWLILSLINIVLEVLAWTIRQGEKKSSLFGRKK